MNVPAQLRAASALSPGQRTSRFPATGLHEYSRARSAWHEQRGRPRSVPSEAVEEEWLDAEAAARHLGLPSRLVYAMIKAGQLPALCFPVRIRRQDLDRCVDRCRIKPGDLAHLDPNANRRGGGRTVPLTLRGTPDRRYGRRSEVGAKDSPPAR